MRASESLATTRTRRGDAFPGARVPRAAITHGSIMRALSAFLCSAALACGNSQPPAEPTHDAPQPRQVSTNVEFTLRRGERASVDGGALLITFLSVANDSRCPSDAVCVWQGDAAMVVRIEGGHSEAPTVVDTLHTELEPRAVKYIGFTVAVKGLLPYPKSSEDPGSRDYRLSLLVTRGGG